MSSRMYCPLLTFAFLILSVNSQYVIPPIEFQALTPNGLRVSIPNVPGIKLFSFHGKVNEEIGPKEAGNINGDVTVSKNGRWIFEDLNVNLALDDSINYWVFVQHELNGFRKDKQVYVVKKLVPANTAWSKPPTTGTGGGTGGTKPVPVDCPLSTTTMNDGRTACKGQVIFEENFNNLDRKRWIVEQRLPDNSLDDPFVSYQPTAVAVEQNQLVITPLLQHIIPPFDEESITSGSLDLSNGCTASSNNFCYISEVIGSNILPPVVSGRISSKNSFSFKYGKVEIRAKVPQGDWLYPEFYLLPTKKEYGDVGYESGCIRIAFARGNSNLASTVETLNNNVLSGGFLIDASDTCRAYTTKTRVNVNEPWGNDFHVYGITWQLGSIVLSVDGVDYGTINAPNEGFKKIKTICPAMKTDSSRWSSGSYMAPFDKEFHIVLGVGVGGVSDFPDQVAGKPWKNLSNKAKINFWKSWSTWSATWLGNQNLYVDYVKVTAL